MKKLLLALLVTSSSFAMQYEAQERLTDYVQGRGFNRPMVGTAQNFTSCQLADKVEMKLTEGEWEDGVISFNASQVNNWKARNPERMYPITGEVVYEVLDENGELLEFFIPNGKVKSFEARPNKFYVVESDFAYENRKKLRDGDCVGRHIEGKFIASATFFLNEVEVTFYELQPLFDTEEIADDVQQSNEPKFQVQKRGVMFFDVKHGNLHKLQRHHGMSRQNRRYFNR